MDERAFCSCGDTLQIRIFSQKRGGVYWVFPYLLAKNDPTRGTFPYRPVIACPLIVSGCGGDKASPQPVERTSEIKELPSEWRKAAWPYLAKGTRVNSVRRVTADHSTAKSSRQGVVTFPIRSTSSTKLSPSCARVSIFRESGDEGLDSSCRCTDDNAIMPRHAGLPIS